MYPPSDKEGGLYCGNLQGAKQTKALKSKGVSVVFTVAAQTGLVYQPSEMMTHHVYNVQDSPIFQFFPFFDSIVDLMHGYRQQGLTVFVHCFMGISRAATITTAYLMKY